MPTTAQELFREALDWLQEEYERFTFFVERDIVWTLQLKLRSLIQEQRAPFSVFNDFPFARGPRRSLCADIGIVSSESNRLLLIAEFKYEPDRKRTDIHPSKVKDSVVFWGINGVEKDVIRVREAVQSGLADFGYSIFIDEGGRFSGRSPHSGADWNTWGANRWILISSNSK